MSERLSGRGRDLGQHARALCTVVTADGWAEGDTADLPHDTRAAHLLMI